MELFIKHQVDMVITGHDHRHHVQVLGNTTHIIMDALLDGQSNAGFLKVNMKNGQVEYSFNPI